MNPTVSVLSNLVPVSGRTRKIEVLSFNIEGPKLLFKILFKTLSWLSY